MSARQRLAHGVSGHPGLPAAAVWAAAAAGIALLAGPAGLALYAGLTVGIILFALTLCGMAAAMERIAS